MKPSNNLRVLLDEKSYQSIEEMIEVLKKEGSFIKINPSRLSSWIITHFRNEMFEKCKQAIIQEHFNSKDYLKDLASKIDGNENVADLLNEALLTIQTRNKANRINAKSKKEKTHKESESERVQNS